MTTVTLSPKLFRQGIWASIASSIVGLAFDLAIPDLIPASVHDAHSQSFQAMSTWRLLLTCLYFLVYVVAGVVVTVGLYRFRPWARSGNLYLIALAAPLFLLLGSNLQSGLALSFYNVGTMIWGGVTCATYFSDLSTRFDRVQPSSDRSS